MSQCSEHRDPLATLIYWLQIQDCQSSGHTCSCASWVGTQRALRLGPPCSFLLPAPAPPPFSLVCGVAACLLPLAWSPPPPDGDLLGAAQGQTEDTGVCGALASRATARRWPRPHPSGPQPGKQPPPGSGDCLMRSVGGSPQPRPLLPRVALLPVLLSPQTRNSQLGQPSWEVSCVPPVQGPRVGWGPKGRHTLLYPASRLFLSLYFQPLTCAKLRAQLLSHHPGKPGLERVRAGGGPGPYCLGTPSFCAPLMALKAITQLVPAWP